MAHSDEDAFEDTDEAVRADAEVAMVMPMLKTGASFGEATRVWSTLLAVGGGLALGRGTVKHRCAMD